MPRPSLRVPTTLALALALTACQGGETKPTDTKKTEAAKKTETPPPPAEDVKRDPGTSLDKAVTTIDLAGPVPPEASAAFFTVDGALVPIACYLHDKKKLASGKDCLKVVKQGDEVYLKNKSVENLDKIGPAKDPMCEAGGGGTGGLSVPAVDAGAAFDFAVSPKSLARQVILLPEDSWSEKKPPLAAEEIAAITGLSKVAGELQIRQVAIQDLDADGAPEKIVSVFQINPKDSERFSFSGVFLQRGSAPGVWTTVFDETATTESYTVRAALDLDGDKTSELWITAITTDGRGGDRVYQLTKDGAAGIGKWSCGL